MSDTQKLPAIDPKTFWRTLGERATGMTIVTASGAEGPAGFLGTRPLTSPPTRRPCWSPSTARRARSPP